jgi:hypothetical protein
MRDPRRAPPALVAVLVALALLGVCGLVVLFLTTPGGY